MLRKSWNAATRAALALTQGTRASVSRTRDVFGLAVRRLRRLRELRHNREIEREMAADFRVVEEAWGLRPKHLPRITRNLHRSMWATIALMVYALTWLIIESWQVLFDGQAPEPGLMFSLALVAVVTSLRVLDQAWRYHVIRTRRFQPFRSWFWREAREVAGIDAGAEDGRV